MAGKKKIFIVDDEQDIRTYLSTLFEDHGYTTASATDGQDAWGRVEAERPDLITLDVSMPEKSGAKFLRDLKSNESLKKIPVIIVTGVSEEFKKFISSRHKVPPPEGFVSKPIDQREILDLVARLLG